ncbi:DegT/DnrJ/EryC1/StrS family aminotransferase [Phreatobacter stygius]|uniref:DegT/DnrJ/EryC1/StrS family aminotransferase n=2 Tax=Phreatobacter stygius TaxID=1940610 RepID=A0A4D7BEY2_9HYPH|nr:DegT/DnrJ/EryC1/StrS family aminotransferase [Phreatobacter stygius]
MSSPDINEDDIALVTEILRSGQLSIGPYLEKFEALIADYVGARHAVAVANGTAGLHLCMRLAGVDDGGEVITSPFSFVASANCILYERGKPVFVDIDEESLNIDTRLVEAAITARTRAILPIHVFGQPADMDRLNAIATRHSVTVVEDACEALGSEYKGRKVGTFGQAAVFAFYPNKQMTTGEGGVVVTDDPEWAKALRSLRNQGRAEMGGWLTHDRLGFNYRLDEMSAGLGVSQLSRVESLLGQRSAVAARYHEALKRIPGVRPIMPCGGTTRMSWFVYVVRLDDGLPREDIAQHMAAQGIPTRNYFPPIHLQPFYRRDYGYRPGQFPIAERVSATTLALPFHGRLNDQDIERVCDGLARAINAVAPACAGAAV